MENLTENSPEMEKSKPKIKTYSANLRNFNSFPHYYKNVDSKKPGIIIVSPRKINNYRRITQKQEILVEEEPPELLLSPPLTNNTTLIDLPLDLNDENKVDETLIPIKNEDIGIDYDDYDVIIGSQDISEEPIKVEDGDFQIKEEHLGIFDDPTDRFEQQTKIEPIKIDEEDEQLMEVIVAKEESPEQGKEFTEITPEVKGVGRKNKRMSLRSSNLRNNGENTSKQDSKETKKDAAIQVYPNLAIRFTMLIVTDKDLHELTAIPTFRILETLEHLVNIIEYKPGTAKMSISDIIIMTFMKFKQNLSYATLAVMFKCRDAEVCRKTIFLMVDILNICLRPSIYWPDKLTTSKSIPKSFPSFEKIRMVVDSIEICAEKSLLIDSQLENNSYYKNNYKIKFMIGITPTGLISFASKPYDGHISETFIFKNCARILDRMERGDILMATNGFRLAEVCQKRGVIFVTPEYLNSTGDKLSDLSLIKMRGTIHNNIKNAEKYLSNIRERFNAFEILDNMPVCLLNKIDQVVNIMCGLFNLSRPVLK